MSEYQKCIIQDFQKLVNFPTPPNNNRCAPESGAFLVQPCSIIEIPQTFHCLIANIFKISHPQPPTTTHKRLHSLLFIKKLMCPLMKNPVQIIHDSHVGQSTYVHVPTYTMLATRYVHPT